MADERVFPIFPLEAVLLVPGALLPLHIFEPRYRVMLADVLDGEGLIAMAMPVLGHATSDEDRPPVHPIVGLGRIVRHVDLPDGRSNVVLEGVARMRIEEELASDRPYRVVRASPVEDAIESTSIRRQLESLAARIPDIDKEAVRVMAFSAPVAVADMLLLRLPIGGREKHEVFALPSVEERVERMHRICDVSEGRYSVDVGDTDPRVN